MLFFSLHVWCTLLYFETTLCNWTSQQLTDLVCLMCPTISQKLKQKRFRSKIPSSLPRLMDGSATADAELVWRSKCKPNFVTFYVELIFPNYPNWLSLWCLGKPLSILLFSQHKSFQIYSLVVLSEYPFSIHTHTFTLKVNFTVDKFLQFL